MEAMQWMLQNSGETLLLVAVDASAADNPGTYPCRVVGTFSAWAQPHAAPDDAARISRLLSEIGVPANLLGCAYLRTALTLLLAEPALGRAITRNLYPRIAKEHPLWRGGIPRGAGTAGLLRRRQAHQFRIPRPDRRTPPPGGLNSPKKDLLLEEKQPVVPLTDDFLWRTMDMIGWRRFILPCCFSIKYCLPVIRA